MLQLIYNDLPTLPGSGRTVLKNEKPALMYRQQPGQLQLCSQAL